LHNTASTKNGSETGRFTDGSANEIQGLACYNAVFTITAYKPGKYIDEFIIEGHCSEEYHTCSVSNGHGCTSDVLRLQKKQVSRVCTILCQ